MSAMTPAEVHTFLTAGTRTGKLATTRLDGTPHVVPIWFIVRDGDIVFNTQASSVKVKNMRRDPRVAISVDEQIAPYSFVTVQDTPTLQEDDPHLLEIATEIGGRYMGEDRAEEFGRRNGVPSEVVVRVSMERVISAKNVAE